VSSDPTQPWFAEGGRLETLRRLDHVGVIVDDLGQGKRFLAEVFGLSLEREYDLKDRGSKVAFFRSGDTEIELIQLTDLEASEKRLRGRQGRVDHIGFEVDDLEKTVAELRARGVETTETPPRRLAVAFNCWTRAVTSDGVTYQLTQ
jgi:catechol 2,3-dioxygenase-like lactoylglutathione lyase family enzyme